MAIDDGVFTGEIGLVKVVSVFHVTAVDGIKDNWGVGANEHSNGTSTAGRTSSTLGIDGDIAGDNNGVAAIPRRGFDPVDSVEKGISTTVAGIDCVDAFDIVIFAKELSNDGLDRLGLVQKSFSADFEATNRLGVDLVVF